MPPSIDLFISIVFISSFIGILTAIILFLANDNETFPSRILSFFLLAISIANLTGGLFYSDTFLRFPHFTRLGLIPSVCASPLAYLYVRSVLEQEYRLKKYDFLLFVPIIFYAASFIPYYTLSAEEKLVYIKQIIADKNLITLEPEGMLPLGWGWIFRAGYSFVLSVAQFRLLHLYRKKIIKTQRGLVQNRMVFSWLSFFSAMVFSLFFILFFEVILHISRFFELFRLLTLTISVFIISVSVYLFSRPRILYGLTGYLQPEPMIPESVLLINKESSDAPSMARATTITHEQALQFRNQLESFFESHKPFLKPGYKVKQLSEDLDIPFYQLSAFINQEYGQNFNELINQFRVKHLETMVKESPEFAGYTLEALGKLAGFNSRSTFIAAVKKNTGKTPQEFFGPIFAG